MLKMKKQLLSPLKMLGDMDQYSIASQGNIFPCHKNYLHGKWFVQNILWCGTKYFKKIPSYSHEHVHLLIDFKLAIEISKH
jgi:hypothetical protein